MGGRAELVLEAFDSRRLIDLLSSDDPSLDEDGAYTIAAEVHAQRMRRGERPVGRKIGFSNRNTWARYGVDGPMWGYVYDTTVVRVSSGQARASVAGLLQPRIEPEIQLHFARTPPVTRDEAAILECIDWIALGFELVQCPYAGWRFRGVDTIAAYALHGGLVVGAPVAVADIEDCVTKLRSFTVTLSRNGVQRGTGGASDVLGSPLLAFAHIAVVLAAQTRAPAVASGEIVSTGTLTPIFPVEAGETWAVAAGGIDLPALSLAIDPIDLRLPGV